MKSRKDKNQGEEKYDPFAPQPFHRSVLKSIYKWQIAHKKAFDEAMKESGEVPQKPKQKLVEQTSDGTFLYKGKPADFNDPVALYAKVFRAIFRNQNSSGYAPYTAINRSMELEGAEKVLDREKMIKRIRNAVDDLFRHSDFPKTVPTGELLLETKRGKGIILRNPEIG